MLEVVGDDEIFFPPCVRRDCVCFQLISASSPSARPTQTKVRPFHRQFEERLEVLLSTTFRFGFSHKAGLDSQSATLCSDLVSLASFVAAVSVVAVACELCCSLKGSTCSAWTRANASTIGVSNSAFKLPVCKKTGQSVNTTHACHHTFT